MSGSVKLTATVERKHPRLPRFVVIPHGKVASWKLDGTTVVQGTLDETDLGRRSLKRWDQARWFIDLPNRLCREAGVDTGDRVTLILRRASTELPAELKRLLANEPAARAAWDRLTPSRQRMLREHVAAAKGSATRTRRAAKALLNREA